MYRTNPIRSIGSRTRLHCYFFSLSPLVSRPLSGAPCCRRRWIVGHRFRWVDVRETRRWGARRYESNVDVAAKNRGRNNKKQPRESLETIQDFVWLRFCWSYNDIKRLPFAVPAYIDQAEAHFIKLPSCSLDAIQSKALEIFEEETRNLEYYNGEDWMPLSKTMDLESFKGKVLCLRIPEYYEKWAMIDDKQDGDAAEEGEGDPSSSSSVIHSSPPEAKATLYPMERVIRDLSALLQSQGYQRSPVKAFTLLNRQEQTTLPTRTWVLQQAATTTRTELRSLLLQHPGALRHMVHCLHYDVLWRSPPPPPPRSPGMTPGRNVSFQKIFQ